MRDSYAVFRELEAVLFDLDGVLTPTASVHMRAWGTLFSEYFAARGVQPAYTDADYFTHIDGKPRYDGVRDMLASRGLELPLGEPTDSSDKETVCGLGNRKNDLFMQELRSNGVRPYPGTEDALDALTAAGKKIAVVSSSKNALAVLEAAGLRSRFDVVVDGEVAASHGIPGKPKPDTYLYGAKLVGIPADKAAVIEDATSGVAAGAAGDFGMVVGVDRGVGAPALRAAGADIVITSLTELSALERQGE